MEFIVTMYLITFIVRMLVDNHWCAYAHAVVLIHVCAGGHVLVV